MLKAPPESSFGALRADARVAEIGRVAVGTLSGDMNPAATDMAAQAVVRLMVGVRNRTVRALRHPGAVRALQYAGIATTIQKENRLFSPLETMVDRIKEERREYGRMPGLLGLLVHIHQVNRGK